MDEGCVLTIADAKTHLLLELPHETYLDPLGTIKQLADWGIQTVMTHPERHRYLAQSQRRLLAWIDAGAVLQVTAGSLLGEQACYRGPAGSTARCGIARTGNAISTESVSLAPRESMTIAVGFVPGTVQQTVPAPLTGFGWWGLAAMPVVAALLLGLALVVRARRLGNLLLREDAPIQYTAPDVPPILAADFLGLPERGAAAQLTQLVLDGHATITADGWSRLEDTELAAVFESIADEVRAR